LEDITTCRRIEGEQEEEEEEGFQRKDMQPIVPQESA